MPPAFHPAIKRASVRWDLSAKFERKLLALFKDCPDLEVPESDWLVEVLPEVKVLEAETLEVLLGQVEQHVRYERAARELVVRAREKMQDEHDQDMNELRMQLESDSVRKSVGAEMKLKALDEQAREEQEEIREEAQQKITALEETVEELEAQLEKAQTKIEETEESARLEVAQMQEKCEEMLSALEDAQSETELKREANMKLKEEIIGNDHLTVANLNRIKFLEAENEKMRAQIEVLDQENDEVREELMKTREEKENGASDEEVKELKEALAEREAQLISISHRLADATGGSGVLTPSRREERRDDYRQSLLDRIGLANLKTSVV